MFVYDDYSHEFIARHTVHWPTHSPEIMSSLRICYTERNITQSYESSGLRTTSSILPARLPLNSVQSVNRVNYSVFCSSAEVPL